MEPRKKMFLVTTVAFLFFSIIVLVAFPALAKDKVKSLKDLDCDTNEIAKFNGEDWECDVDRTGGGGGGGLTGYEIIRETCSAPCPTEIGVSCIANCSSGKLVLSGFSRINGGEGFEPAGGILLLTNPPGIEAISLNRICFPEAVVFRVEATVICANGQIDCSTNDVCNEACAPGDDPDC